MDFIVCAQNLCLVLVAILMAGCGTKKNTVARDAGIQAVAAGHASGAAGYFSDKDAESTVVGSGGKADLATQQSAGSGGVSGAMTEQRAGVEGVSGTITQPAAGSGGKAGATAGSDGNATGQGGVDGRADRTCSTKATTCGGQPCSVENIKGNSILAPSTCVQACCTAKDSCGLALIATIQTGAQQNATACIELNQEGNEYVFCPYFLDSLGVAGGFISLGDRNGLVDINYQGCCRPDGACGFLVTSYGLGCVSIEEFSTVTALIPGMVPSTPRDCFL
jgi:hypothetical protein